MEGLLAARAHIRSWPHCWYAMVRCCCVTGPLAAGGIRTSGTCPVVTWNPVEPTGALGRELEEELGILIDSYRGLSWLGSSDPNSTCGTG